MKKIIFTCLLVAALLLPSQSFAAFNANFNPEINYQGRLVTSSDTAVADGTYNMRFNLYTSLSGGSPVWTETLTGANRVQVTNSLFSLMLGSTTPLTGVNFNQPLYLGVEIGGITVSPSWDGEMVPRKVLGAVPAALVADTLDGLDSTQFVRSDADSTINANLTINGNATTSAFAITGLSSSLLKTTASGSVVAAVAGTDYIANTSGDWSGTFGGKTSAFYLANSFSTTSANAYLGTKNTDNLAEGISNFYFTQNHFDTALAATTTLNNLTTLKGLTDLIVTRSTTTNATTTNLFSTTASSTNLFASLLHVGSNALNVNSNGLIGVGTNNPLTALDIHVPDSKLGIRITDDTSGHGIDFQGNTPAINFNQYWDGSQSVAIGDDYTAAINLITDNGGIEFDTGDNPGAGNPVNLQLRMVLDEDGNLGIGNDSPAALLDLGAAGSVPGVIRFAGSSSGNITLQTTANAGANTITLPATTGTLITTGDTNTVTDAMTANNLTISGGTINNTPIGATTPSTGVFTNSTSTNATSTNFFATTASTSNLFAASINGAGLSTCNSGSNALTWNGGTFGCNSITSSSASSTLLTDNNSFTGTDTFSNLFATNATATNATTTNLFATTASSTNLFFTTAKGGNEILTGALTVNGFSTSTFAGSVAVGGTKVYADGSFQRGNVAFGNAQSSSFDSITAKGIGSLAGGNTSDSGGGGGTITSSGVGSVALGYAESLFTGTGGKILSFGGGSFALGATTDRTITAAGEGTLAGGYANAGNITANTNGAFAWGDNISATANYATAFGTGFANTTTNSFQVGYGATPTLTVNATSTIISGNLSVSGNSTTTNATTTNFFATNLVATNLTGTNITAGTFSGAGLTGCSGASNALIWSSGTFGCNTVSGGGGGGTDVNWSFFNNSGIRVATTTNQVLIGAVSTSSLSKLQVVGGATIDSATTTNATTTSLFATNATITNASTTNFFGAGLTTCNTSSALTYNGSGQFGCTAISASSASTTLLSDNNAFTGKNTFTDLTVTRSTTTNATTTNLFVSNFINTTSLTGGYQIDGVTVLQASTTLSNIAIGDHALSSNTVGTGNVAVGSFSLNANTTGFSNSAFGLSALINNTVGNFNVAVGTSALNQNTTGSQNAAMGWHALAINGTGSQNTAIGHFALGNNTDATSSTAVGYNAAGSSVNYHAQNLTAIGANALANIHTGADDNTALGVNAGQAITTGAQNTLLGFQAGNNLTTGSSNILLGYNINAPTVSSSNTLNIGNLLFGTGVDGTGNTLSSGNIGIGIVSPNFKFEVQGTASTTNFFSGLGTFANLLATGSSTLQNFTAINSTTTSATTTNLFATTASTTNFFGAGLTTCNTGTKTLTYNGSGQFGCTTISTASTTLLADNNGFTGIDTFTDLIATRSTTTNATTTNFFATTASSTNLFASLLTVGSNALKVISGGNVGIGTSTPFSRLSIATSTFSNAAFPIGLNVGPRGLVSASANGTVIGVNTNSFSGDLLNLQVNGEQELRLTNNGRLTLGTGTTDPGAWGIDTAGDVHVGGDFTTAGTAQAAGGFYITGSSIITAPSGDGTLQLSNNAGTDFNRLQFGGVTSAFPSLKRNGTEIDFRLADDSGNANFVAGNATTTAATTTSLFATNATITNASTTNFFGAGLTTCNTSSKALTYNGSGKFGCATISTASTTLLTDNNGFTGANTFDNIVRSTTTNATTTNFFASNFINTTSLTGGYQIDGTTILQASTTRNLIAIGPQALQSNTTGQENIAIGLQTLGSNTSGFFNDALGYQALFKNTTGNSNVAFGDQALVFNTTGSSNTAVGIQTLADNTTGTKNAAFGAFALENNISATSSTAVGWNAAGGSTFYNAQNITAVGNNALAGLITGSDDNTALGTNAGQAVSSGSKNTLLGFQAGNNLTTGSSNIVLGYNINTPSVSSSNTLNIGNLLFGTGVDGTGNTLSSGNLGVGIVSPNFKFEVQGTASTTNFYTSNSTTTSATTTNLFTSLLAGAGLTSCNGTANAVTWNAGSFGCNTITAPASSDKFATSTNGLVIYANSATALVLGESATSTPNTRFEVIGGLFADRSTTTNATTTNLFSTTASSTNLFSTNSNLGVVTSGLVNGQRITSAANFTGSLTASTLISAGSFSSGVNATSTLHGSLVIGNTSGLFANAPTSSNNGDLTVGFNTGGGTVDSTGAASLAIGSVNAFISSPVKVLSSGSGSLAVGHAESAFASTAITSSGNGSTALGFASDENITSSGNGSLAGGEALTGNVTATANGAFAWGDNVNATANYATAFGSGFTNNTANSFKVGYSATPTFTVNATGVGIGTTTPPSRLSVATSTAYNAAFPDLLIGPRGLVSGNSAGTIIGVNTDSFSGDFVNLQNNGSQVFSVDLLGRVNIGNNLTVGTGPSSGNLIINGGQLLWSGGTVVDGNTNGQFSLTNSGGSGFTRLNLGGITSAFPALGVNGKSLIVQLADGTNGGSFAVGTSTPRALVTFASSTAPQLTLSDATAGDNAWNFRNAGGTLYLATSSPSTFATSSVSALTINTNGLLTFNALNTTTTNATTTALFATNATITNASTTNFFGAGLTTCNTGSNALTYNGSGKFGCTTISTASSTLLTDNNAFTGANSFSTILATGSTTLQNFTFTNATGTNATTTNLFSTTASSTNLFFTTAKGGNETLAGALTVTGLATSTFAGSIAVGSTKVYADGSFGRGNIAFGNTTAPGSIVSKGFGSLAGGQAADNFGSGESIISQGSGSVALGYAEDGFGPQGHIISTGSGSFALGAASGMSINSNGQGTFAGGYASAGNITANSSGSFAWGDNLSATANYATAFGTGFANTTANSFQVGYSSTPTLTVNATSTIISGGLSILGNSTTTNATTTALFATNATITNASTTNFFGAGLATCNTGSNALTYNGSGKFGCTTIGSASTTLLTDNNTFSGTTNFSGNVTLTNATSTNSFATTASSTNLYSTNSNLGTVTSGLVNGQTISSAANFTGTLTATAGLSTFSNTLHTGSTTLQNFTGINSTTTSATTTSLFATTATITTASTTNFFGAGLSTCNTSSKALTYNGSGQFGCATLSSASTTLLTDNNGFTGIDTFTDLIATRSTTTNATSTNFFSTTASSTNLFASLLTVGSNALSVNSSGNVGVGTSSPFAKLSIQGNDSSGIADAPVAFAVYGGDGGSAGGGGIDLIGGSGGTQGGIITVTGGQGQGGGTGGDININGGLTGGAGGSGGSINLTAADAASVFGGTGGNITLNAGGPGSGGTTGFITLGTSNAANVGIGTSNPHFKLEVNGTASTTKLFVSYSTTTNATTTNLFATTASTTNFFGAGLTTCNTSSALTYNGAGKFGCTAISGSSASSTLLADNNSFTGANTFSTLLVTGSTTLQSFTFVNATGTSATTTNFFATTASATNLFATNSNLGAVTSGLINGQTISSAANFTGTLTATAGLSTFSNILATGSTTLQNFTGINSTTTNATTTALFATNATFTSASTTNFFGAGLTTCNSASNALTYNGSGKFGCSSITTAASSTLLADNNTFTGTNSFSNLTVTRFIATNSTTTNATTTNFFATTASSTNLFASNLHVGSNTLNIGSNGLIGVGTNNPITALDIHVPDSKLGIRITDDTSGHGIDFQGNTPAINFNQYWDGSQSVAIGNDYTAGINLITDNGGIEFDTGDNPGAGNPTNLQLRMVLDEDGNLGIGNDSPGALLDLGSAGTTAGVIRLAGGTSGNITLQVPAIAGTNTITFPATTGTVITDGDTGTVTNTMLAGGISDAKVADNLTISGGTINNTPIGATTASTGVFTNATATNATTTALFATNATITNASTTNFFGAGLTTCNTSSALTYNGAGKFGCTAISGSSASTTLLVDNNAFTGANTFTTLLATGSTTLQNFTFNNATGTSATTTNLFATTASTTNLFATNSNLGVVTSGLINGQTISSSANFTGTLTATAGLSTFSNVLAIGSSTLQNFTGINSTTTNATTTALFATNATITNASTTNFFGAGLTTCNTGSNALTYNGSGKFGCATLSSASTTLLADNNSFTGANTFSTLLLTGSSTLQSFTFVNATGTNATTTNFFATTASTTNLFATNSNLGVVTSGLINGQTISSAANFTGTLTATAGLSTFSNILATGSTTLQNFTFTNATGTNATTTNFFATVASSTSLFATNALISTSTTTNATTTALFATNATITNASTTNFFGAGLTTCNTSSALTYNGSGKFGCTAISAGSSASSTLLADNNAFTGLNNFSDLTVTRLNVTNSTTTNATTTNFFATTASSTNLFASLVNFGSNAFVVNAAGAVGVGTSTPGRKLNVLDAGSNAQVRLSQSGTVFAELYADASGDLQLSATGGNIRMNDDNLWVCSGGSCGATPPSGSGNIIVENAIKFDNNFSFKNVDASTTAMYDSAANEILQFDEAP